MDSTFGAVRTGRVKRAAPVLPSVLSGGSSAMVAKPIPRWAGLALLLTISVVFGSNHVAARFAFERDLAMTDDAIKKMKKEVKRNPNDEAAKQVLRASYQNKIDLLKF